MRTERLSGGASRETWAVDVALAGGSTRSLIVQRERSGAVRPGAMAVEAHLLVAAAEQDVPVPPLVTSGDGEDGVGAPYLVMDRIDGETIPRRILREDEYEQARSLLTAQCAEALAGIHRIPVEAAPGIERPDQVAQFRDYLDALGEPHPALELGFRWLDANRPEPTRETVVHGDFRNGNLIVGPEGLRAVLDWELAHVGDPMEDLAWLCVRAWRFGEAPPVGGFGEREELYAAYEAASGHAVDPAVVHWYEALGTLKWGVMGMIQAAAHLTGASRSVELAAIGRRVCETELDLLELLP